MPRPVEARPRVIFSHGLESGPAGSKITALRPVAEARGWDSEAIDYRDLRNDPQGRVQRLVERLAEIDEPVVLVGSSLGSYVSVSAAERRPVAGLFLMAPALFQEHRWGLERREAYAPKTDHIHIVHGWEDEVIPWRDSVEFAAQRRARLSMFDADHRLTGVVPELQRLLAVFLERQ